MATAMPLISTGKSMVLLMLVLRLLLLLTGSTPPIPSHPIHSLHQARVLVEQQGRERLPPTDPADAASTTDGSEVHFHPIPLYLTFSHSITPCCVLL